MVKELVTAPFRNITRNAPVVIAGNILIKENSGQPVFANKGLMDFVRFMCVGSNQTVHYNLSLLPNTKGSAYCLLTNSRIPGNLQQDYSRSSHKRNSFTACFYGCT
jgi:hypothetical protein